MFTYRKRRTNRDSISTIQQVIAGLADCQTAIEDLLKIVESSNKRIKDLLTLNDKVDKLSSDQVVDADRGGNDRCGVKLKHVRISWFSFLINSVSVLNLRQIDG